MPVAKFDSSARRLEIGKFDMPLTRELIGLIRRKPIRAHDLRQAALLALDAVANCIAGANSDPGRRFLAWARDAGIVTAGGLAGDPGRSAFLLGSLCHILELDDLHRNSVVHPGCAVAPVLWAETRRTPDRIDGKLALSALLHGFEAATRLGMAVGPAHYRIWHNTATCGPFGSALAAASLRGLDDEATVHALGNAGTQAAGLWQFLDTGAMSKHIHAGRAAEAGLIAADLAKHGITGAPDILEGDRGFFAAMCPDGDPDRLGADPDGPWQAHRTSIKPWPSCRHTHPAIDAGQELRGRLLQAGTVTDAIQSVVVDVYPAAIALCDRPQPESLYAAKFSLQHCVAAALSHEEVWFGSFDGEARTALAPLRARCRVRGSRDLADAYPDAWGARVELQLQGGGLIEATRSHAKGDPELPLTGEEMTAKARRLLLHGGVEAPEAFIDAVLAMADGGPLPALPAPFGPPAAGTTAAEASAGSRRRLSA